MLIIYHNTVCLSRYNQPSAHFKLAPGNPVVNKISRLPYYHYKVFCVLLIYRKQCQAHKIFEDMFCGCKTLFSWLGQKENKKIDVLWPRDDAAYRLDIPIPFILQYSNRIWSHWIYVFDSIRFDSIRFDSFFEISKIFHSIRTKFQIRQFHISYFAKLAITFEGLARTQNNRRH